MKWKEARYVKRFFFVIVLMVGIFLPIVGTLVGVLGDMRLSARVGFTFYDVDVIVDMTNLMGDDFMLIWSVFWFHL